MKVFVPMPDEMADIRESAARLVPFNLDLLGQCSESGSMPSNWLSDNDYSSACERLRLNQHREPLALA